MNTKDFIRLGIPLGEATRRATDFVSQFILSGGGKTKLEEELKAIVANPAFFAEDPLRKELAKAIYNAFDHDVIDGQIKPLQVEVKNATYAQEYPFEQVNLDINMKAPRCLDPDYPAMKVLETVLSGSYGRIFQATRGDHDLAYFAYARLASEAGYGYFRVTSQTSLEKAEQLKQVLLHELDRIINEQVTPEEISMAIEANNVQNVNLINDKYMGYISVVNEFKGLGFDYWFKEINELRKVTPDDVQRVAKKYLKDRDVIISIPSKDVQRMVGE